MHRRQHIAAALAVALLFVIVACSGSPDSQTAATGAGGATATTSGKYPCLSSPSNNGTTTLVASNCQPLVPILQSQDEPNNPQLPAYFRNFTQVTQNPPAGFNMTGLAGLPISGSANPTITGFGQVRNFLGTGTIIVDLRAESHAIMDGSVMAWFAASAGVGYNDANKDRSSSQIETNENALIASVQQNPTLGINSEQPPTTSTVLQVQSIGPESEAVQIAQMQYQRLYFQDGEAISDKDVKQLIDIYRGLKPGQQVMVHCNNGWDRTTQALTVLDIINNASKVSLQDIGARQDKFSGNFNKVLDDKRGPLMQRVYDWALANPGGTGDSWDAYAKANPEPKKSKDSSGTTKPSS